ncbi:sensor histidine kinase [Halovivax limisalsi]|uniref:sensor histidine kinase n=1 Tax=Halovivax limisalsi TaxID=1453760 RepID=UPI001FFDC05E|nr:PAS domain-containing sensor histidine kinase [Halovivax limisalsi]
MSVGYWAAGIVDRLAILLAGGFDAEGVDDGPETDDNVAADDSGDPADASAESENESSNESGRAADGAGADGDGSSSDSGAPAGDSQTEEDGPSGEDEPAAESDRPNIDHPDGLLVVEGGEIVAANELAERLLSTGDGSIVGSQLDRVLPPPVESHDLECVIDGQRRRYEPYVLSCDAARSTIDHGWIHLRETSRRTLPYGEAADAEESLAGPNQFEQYETIMDVVPDPVYATDETGTFTFVNRAFEEQFGIDRTTVAESDVHFSAVTTEAGAERIAEAIRDLHASDETPARTTVESVAVTERGRTLTVENSLALQPSDGSFAGTAGVLRDVTDRQRREEILSVMDRALRHNLRTNVNIIAGYAETLEPAVDEDHLEALQTIRRAADWLGKLGETIRTLERSIDETGDPHRAVDVEALLDETADWAAERYPSATVDVTVGARGAIDAGEPLDIALQNVVENAIVHNDRDTPSVEIWVADAPREGWLELSVADDGPGIPADERRVVQGSATPTQLTHGSGLGLWLASWIVQVFDGEFEIRDNDPRGTVVTFRLRRLVSEESVDDE